MTASFARDGLISARHEAYTAADVKHVLLHGRASKRAGAGKTSIRAPFPLLFSALSLEDFGDTPEYLTWIKWENGGVGP